MIIVKENRVTESDPYKYLKGADVAIFNSMIKSAEAYIKNKNITAERLKMWPTSLFEDWSLAFAAVKAWNIALKKTGLGQFTI